MGMRHARFFSVLVFALMALYGAVGFYFLPLASFTGPLTRMGKISESLFGWTREQPAINPVYLVNASWQEADMLAIGDSFSMPRLWQSALVQRGIKVHTETWEAMRNICEDFPEWLHGKGFKGRYVVIEVVEHNFQDTLDRSLSCKQTFYHPMRYPPLSPPPRRITCIHPAPSSSNPTPMTAHRRPAPVATSGRSERGSVTAVAANQPTGSSPMTHAE